MQEIPAVFSMSPGVPSRIVLALLIAGVISSCEVRRISDLTEIASELGGSAEHLKDGGVESAYEIFYGDQKDWALAVLPSKGDSASWDLAGSGAILADLEKATKGLKPNQYLVAQVDGQRAQVQTLSAQGILVERPFLVVGRGPVIIEARVVAERNGPPRLVSFEAKKRP